MKVKHDIFTRKPNADKVLFCCSCCFCESSKDNPLQEAGDLDGSPTLLCKECVDKMVNNGELIVCHECGKPFHPYTLRQNPETWDDELCPLCGNVWTGNARKKKAVVCGVLVQRAYTCTVVVDADASDDEIREAANLKILDCGEDALTENNFAGICASDIVSVEPTDERYDVDEEEE